MNNKKGGKACNETGIISQKSKLDGGNWNPMPFAIITCPKNHFCFPGTTSSEINVRTSTNQEY